MLESFDLQGALQFLREHGTTPEALQAIGAFVVFVVGYHAARLTFQAVRGPLSLGWIAAKFLGGGTVDVARLAAWPVGTLLKRKPESPLFAVCKAALENERLAHQSAFLGSPENMKLESEGGNVCDFGVRFGEKKEPPAFFVNGECINTLLSKREHKQLSRMARAMADKLKAGDDQAQRELLAEHLARKLAPKRSDLRGGTGKPSVRDELANVASKGSWTYHG